MRVIAAISSAILLSGCAGAALMFPANEQAQAVGLPKLTFRSYGIGSGPMSVTMPDGEVLIGRYSINIGGTQGFGSLYGSVYGTGGSASAYGSANSLSLSMTNPGTADAAGPKTSLHCEIMNGPSGHGNGVCETISGARYRIQY